MEDEECELSYIPCISPTTVSSTNRTITYSTNTMEEATEEGELLYIPCISPATISSTDQTITYSTTTTEEATKEEESFLTKLIH